MERAGRFAEGSQREAGSVAGKKRKKKKKEEKGRNGGENGKEHRERPPAVALRGTKIDTPATANGSSPPSMEPAGSISAVVPCTLSSGSYLKLSDECYSSSSSLEISRPMYKLGRFDFSSSDAMSVGQTSTSTMEASSANQSNSGSPQSKTRVPLCSDMTRQRTLHTTKSAQSHNSIEVQPSVHALTNSTLTGASSSNDDTSVSSSVADSVNMSTHSAMDKCIESLRWKDECSDEEREQERIELYKANRRKRYENARKSRFERMTDRKIPYYQSSETIS